MASLVSRFSVLPRMQEERQYEANLLAQQAQQNTRRLQETREEAERIMKEEMDRTRRIELDLIERHPTVLRWAMDRAKLQSQMEEWNASQAEQQRRRQIEWQMLRTRLQAKESLLETFLKEQAESQQKAEQLRMERDRLEHELAEARKAENEARARHDLFSTDRLKQQVGDCEKHLAQIMSTLDRMAPEKAAAEANIATMEHQIGQLKMQIDSAGVEAFQCEDRRKTLLNDIERAKTLSLEAQQAADEHRGMLSALKTSVSSNEEKFRKAQATAKQAHDLKNQTAGLLGRCREQLGQVKNESESLKARRDAIQRQIEQLLREQMDVSDKLSNNMTEEQRLGEEISLLDRDYHQADSFYQEAIEAQHRMQEETRQHDEGLRNQQQIIDAFMSKKNDADLERREAEEALKGVEARWERIKPRYLDSQNSIYNLEQKIQHEKQRLAEMASHQESLDKDLVNYNNALQGLEQQLESSQVEKDVTVDNLNRITNTIRNKNRQVEELDRSLSALGVGHGPRIGQLENEIRALQGELQQLEQQPPLPQVNPYSQQLADLEVQRDDLVRRVMDSFRSSPPQELVDQMQREAEAVMRAELAAGLLTRQVHIESEARSLADLRPNSEPRIVLDDQAKTRLIGEHWEGSDYRRIASTVVELTEQQHIMAQ